MFCYDNKLTYPVYLLNQKFNDNMGLLLMSDRWKFHYVYIKDFYRSMFSKTKNNGKKYFCKNRLQCFSSEEILIEHREDCLVINGKQSVKLESGYISFENYFKQILVPFKIYADFECILKNVDCSYTKKYQDHVPCSFAYKVLCVDNKFSKNINLYREKDAVNKFIKLILSEYNYCKKVIKKHFNKNLIMSAEEERFQLSNICWICNKLFDGSNNKKRDHCHITRKCRGAAHWSWNINLKITKKVPVTFHNLKGYGSHLIFKELRNT